MFERSYMDLLGLLVVLLGEAHVLHELGLNLQCQTTGIKIEFFKKNNQSEGATNEQQPPPTHIHHGERTPLSES